MDPKEVFLSTISAAATHDEKAKALQLALQDPINSHKTLKNLSIGCGISMPELLQIYREGAMIESLMMVADTIANNVNSVVKAALEVGSGVEATVQERKLALEICGVLGDKKSVPNVNVNFDQRSNQSPSFEENAKKGTVTLHPLSKEK